MLSQFMKPHWDSFGYFLIDTSRVAKVVPKERSSRKRDKRSFLN